MNVELLIDNKICDLADVDAVFKFGINPMQSVDSRSGTYSNQFTIPLTNTNIKVMECFNVESAVSNLPYQNVTFEIRYYGNPCLKGIAHLVEVNAEGFVLQCYSDNAEWSSLIKNLSIKDINPQTTVTCQRFPWAVVSTRNNDWTRGFIWPNANFGNITESTAPNTMVSVTWLYPAFYLKFILLKIFEYIGYTPTGEAWNDPKLENVVMFPKAKTKLANTVDLSETHRADANTSAYFSVPAHSTNTYYKVPLDVETYDPSNSFNTTTYEYTAQYPMLVTVHLEVEVEPTFYNSATFIQGVVGVFINGVLQPNGLIVQKYLAPYPPNTFRATLEFTLNLNDTLDIRAGYIGNSIPPLPINVSVDIIPQNVYFDGQPITIGGCFENWKATDFIAQWFNMFAINYSTNNFTKEINFYYSRDVKDSKLQAIDLTEKIDFGSKPTINPYFEEYAQNNVFKYNLDPADWQLFGYDGAASISCGNYTLEESKDVFVSKCALLVRRTYMQGSIELASIPFDHVNNEEISEKIAVLVNDGNFLVVDDLGAGDNPAVQWGLEVSQIDFNTLIPQYYGTIESVLKKPKTITYLTKLNYTDLRNWDWSKAVLIKGIGYFYVNEISDVSLTEDTQPLITLSLLN